MSKLDYVNHIVGVIGPGILNYALDHRKHIAPPKAPPSIRGRQAVSVKNRKAPITLPKVTK